MAFLVAKSYEASEAAAAAAITWSIS